MFNTIAGERKGQKKLDHLFLPAKAIYCHHCLQFLAKFLSLNSHRSLEGIYVWVSYGPLVLYHISIDYKTMQINLQND